MGVRTSQDCWGGRRTANRGGGNNHYARCDVGAGGKGKASVQLASCVEKGEGMAGALLHAYALLASVVGQTPTSAIAGAA